MHYYIYISVDGTCHGLSSGEVIISLKIANCPGMAAATTVGTGHPSMPMTLLVMEITQQKSNGEWKTIIHFSKRPSISINNSFHSPIG